VVLSTPCIAQEEDEEQVAEDAKAATARSPTACQVRAAFLRLSRACVTGH